jgi:hypothetical protein
MAVRKHMEEIRKMERKIYDSIEQIGPEAVASLGGSELDFSYGLLNAVEKGLFGDLVVHYLSLEEDGAIVSLMPVYLGTNVNINALLPRPIQEGYTKLVAWLGDIVKTRFVIAGSLISDKGWIPMRRGAESPELVEEMVGYIDEYAVANKAKVTLLKDIHSAFPAPWLERIESRGFQRLFSLPTVTVDTDYADFDAYIQGLKKNSRKHARKVLKAAAQRLAFETIDDYSDLIDLIYPLFRATYLKAKYQFDEATPYFFAQCAKTRDLGTELIVCKKDGHVVGALINFFNDREQLNKRIGIDYRDEDTPLIYTSLMYEGMRSAINRGLKRVYLGQSTYVPKVRLGGQVEDEYFYVKPYDSALKLSMPWQHRLSSGYKAERVEKLALEGISV